jgi:hypothetical protein
MTLSREKNLVSVAAQPTANALAISLGGIFSLTIQNVMIPGKGTPVTTHRRTLVAVCFSGSKTAMIAVSAKSEAYLKNCNRGNPY